MLFTPALAGAPAVPRFAEEMRLWQLALTSWRQQDGTEAQKALDTLALQFDTSLWVGRYRRLGERVAHSRLHPWPAGRDGTTSFDSK